MLETILSGNVSTPSIALWTTSADANDRPNRTIVLGSRIGYQFHVLDVGGIELSQLLVALHLPVVDVDFWLALAKYLEVAILSSHHRHVFQYIVCRTGMAQLSALHIGEQAFPALLESLLMSLDHHLL